MRDAYSGIVRDEIIKNARKNIFTNSVDEGRMDIKVRSSIVNQRTKNIKSKQFGGRNLENKVEFIPLYRLVLFIFTGRQLTDGTEEKEGVLIRLGRKIIDSLQIRILIGIYRFFILALTDSRLSLLDGDTCEFESHLTLHTRINSLRLEGGYLVFRSRQFDLLCGLGGLGSFLLLAVPFVSSLGLLRLTLHLLEDVGEDVNEVLTDLFGGTGLAVRVGVEKGVDGVDEVLAVDAGVVACDDRFEGAAELAVDAVVLDFDAGAAAAGDLVDEGLLGVGLVLSGVLSSNI